MRPKLCDKAYCDRLRKDYPEHEDWDDEDLIEYYNHGRRYEALWDHVGDAYYDYEKLADSFLKLEKTHAEMERLVDELRRFVPLDSCENCPVQEDCKECTADEYGDYDCTSRIVEFCERKASEG